jgi:hypothetical protein
MNRSTMQPQNLYNRNPDLNAIWIHSRYDVEGSRGQRFANGGYVVVEAGDEIVNQVARSNPSRSFCRMNIC